MTACSLPAVVARLRLAARCRARYFTAVVVVGLVPLALWGASLLVLPRALARVWPVRCYPLNFPILRNPPFRPRIARVRKPLACLRWGARPKRACTLTVTVGCRHSLVRLVFGLAGATIVGPKI